jgi:two-component system, NtrC family, sensor kinase
VTELHPALPAVALVLNLLLAVVALAADSRDRRNRAFAAFAGALAVWNLGVVGLRSAGTPAAALRWEWLIHVAIALVPAFFVQYVLAFLGRRAERSRLLTVTYLLAGAFVLLTPTRWFMAGVQPTVWGYAPVPGPAYGPFLVYLYGFLIGGAVRLTLETQRLRGALVTRARWIAAGLAVSLFGGAFDFVRFVAGWERLYPIGIPANMVFGLALGVAIVRYRLVDISVFVRRTVLYALSSLALAPFLIIAVNAVARAQRGDRAGSLLASLIAAGALAAGVPLLRKLESLLARVMFHREHGVSNALLELSDALNEVSDTASVAGVLTRGLVTEIPLRSAGLYVPEAPTGRFWGIERHVALGDDVEALPETVDAALVEWLAAHQTIFVAEDEILAGPAMAEVAAALHTVHIALAVPVVEDDALAAIVLVGEKRSGAAFRRDELDLLTAVAANAGIALRNARLYDDLRRRIEEVQSAHAQLAQSAKLAALGELAASVAHEVNNPLMVIIANADRLRRDLAGNTNAQTRLTTILEQSQRAANILRRLLDFARRREPALGPLDIREILQRALDLMAVRIAHGRVVLDVAHIDDARHVIGDRDQLTQVFVNLFNNALDAMPHGGVLSVRTETRSAAGIPCFSVSVSDTGIGISTEELPHVFLPFFTTKPEGKGTGLGLSVSLGIVRRHEGTMEVTSEKGKGTTFVVSLPLAK